MRKLYLIPFLCLIAASAAAQQLSLQNLLDLSLLPPQKFSSAVSKKEFRPVGFEGEGKSTTYHYLPSKFKGADISRSITIDRSASRLSLQYRTTSASEAAHWGEEAKKASFSRGATRDSTVQLYQLQHMRLRTIKEKVDSVLTFCLVLEAAQLPRARDILFAEDLLAFDSHERLTYAFGAGNVTKDVFYYDEKDPNRCSVLFPNTAREVIFIWSDENNYKDISFLIVGGHLRTAGTQQFTRQVEQSLWRSKQGVYAGMGLLELQALNQKPIDFYNWGMEEAGMIIPRSKGAVDFTKLGLVLNCLNCAGREEGSSTIANSERELREGRKIYVSTMIILPAKEGAATASVAH